jgi:hypothetical protein
MSGTVTAFFDDTLIAKGPRRDVTRRIEEGYSTSDFSRIRVFDDRTGRVTDLDLRNAASADPDADPETETAPRGRGRPKLGVVAREVTLLPRHWDWLATQPGGASATIRRLVDDARKRRTEAATAADALDGVHRFMTEMAGNRAGYEEALRALYRGNLDRFRALIAPWPVDIVRHLEGLLDREVV